MSFPDAWTALYLSRSRGRDYHRKNKSKLKSGQPKYMPQLLINTILYNGAFGLNLWEKTKVLSASDDSNYGPLFLAAWFKGCNSENTGSFHELFEINQTYEPN